MRIGSIGTLGILSAMVLLPVAIAGARTNIVVVHNANDEATSAFMLKMIPPPAGSDAATRAQISIVDGSRDTNGGELDKLQDGKAPTAADEPSENFFFAAGTSGGRLLFDLGSVLAVEQVNTYSWHPGPRGPQVYKLYASDGTSERFEAAPGRAVDPQQAGWAHVATVDTRPSQRDAGGQYGVSIFAANGPLGQFRYLLFDIANTQGDERFDNTFYSEIDVVAGDATLKDSAAAAKRVATFVTEPAGYQFTIDTSETPDLTQWANEELAPVVRQWYPKIVAMLPSDGYQAPQSFRINFSSSMRGVAATGGTSIRCSAEWFRRNLDGEAKGAVVHELVHVVQQYGLARRNNPNATRAPGWLVEGIADYIRWFLYEPQSRGAEITRRNLDRARYDGSYRVSANFLNWITETHDRELVAKLNAALREGRYRDELWTDSTGRTLEELGHEWRIRLERALVDDAGDAAAEGGSTSQSSPPPINTLSEQERAAGWRLLFNGRDTEGWHSFGANSVRAGWAVRDGALVCADPTDAGDLCTNQQFDWFELRLEYNISPGGNSGIMYHVTDDGNWTWQSGPEVQLQDNGRARDPVLSGWLYALYQPPTDADTGKPLDATRPAGEWNEVRLLVSPEKCEHEINGVKYFEYVLGSEDFQNRVARSKFRRMPLFAKSSKGYIALQGDHGEVSFRNIKFRPLESR